VGGPWFTVLDRRTASNWTDVDTLWLSNGKRDAPARLQVRANLAPLPALAAPEETQ